MLAVCDDGSLRHLVTDGAFLLRLNVQSKEVLQQLPILVVEDHHVLFLK
jgi:hypothetical protein